MSLRYLQQMWKFLFFLTLLSQFKLTLTKMSWILRDLQKISNFSKAWFVAWCWWNIHWSKIHNTVITHLPVYMISCLKSKTRFKDLILIKNIQCLDVYQHSIFFLTFNGISELYTLCQGFIKAILLRFVFELKIQFLWDSFYEGHSLHRKF